MPFFIRNKTSNSKLKKKSGIPRDKKHLVKGRKPVIDKENKTRQRFRGKADEEIDSDSDVERVDVRKRKVETSSSDEDEETAQEKKIRLTKQYLSQIEAEEASKKDDEDDAHDLISHRLKQDVLEQSGRLQKEVADDYLAPTLEDITVLRGHQLSITCIVISPDDKYIYSGSKDCSIIKWCISTGRKVHVIPGGRKGTEDKHIGHTAHVLCIAITSDGKYMASGDRNKLIHIWNPDDCRLIHTFRGHRDVVSGLAFRKGSHQLFSASHDRTVKIWNLDEMAYVETLFGHQDSITAIDSLSRERAVTAGGRDNSIRIWKVIEESQLVFHGHAGSIDCVSLINESNFVSGGDDNCLALWGLMKKKPLALVKDAHSGCQEGSQSDHWILAVASFQNTDLIASGSKDGCLRFWKCCNNFKSLQPLFSLPMCGFVNSIQFSKDGTFLVAGVGQEHKLGRWWRFKQAKNCVCIVKMQKKKGS